MTTIPTVPLSNESTGIDILNKQVQANILKPSKKTAVPNLMAYVLYYIIRESVDSLCRDGADAQYVQYLSKSRMTSPQTCKKLIEPRLPL